MMTDRYGPMPTPPDEAALCVQPSDVLGDADLALLTVSRTRCRRAELELRAAQANLDLLLLNLQEAHALGPGDKFNPVTGAILRAETPQGD